MAQKCHTVCRIAVRELRLHSNIGPVPRLTWSKVDLKAGFIRLEAEDTKEADKKVIPISPALREVLEELREEQRKVANISGKVFTRGARPIRTYRTAFEQAREKIGIKDVILHDYRHTAITRWAMAGIPQEAVMRVSGHRDLSVYYRYVNVQEEHLKPSFPQRCYQTVVKRD